MLIFWRTILLFLALLCSTARLSAASSAENSAFADAVKSFQGGWWDRAERQFGEFAQKFPKSDRLMESVLHQAQARVKEGNFIGAVELLSEYAAQSGKLADTFQFWLGEAHFQNSNYVAAAGSYATLTANFTNSAHFLAASYTEALARSRLNDWPAVIQLLEKPGAFQNAAQNNPTNEFVVRATLLLAEAQLTEGKFSEAEKTLEKLKSLKLKPELDWRRQLLLCRVQLADHRLEDALQGATNLVELARATSQANLIAESVSIQAGILEQLKRPDEAAAAYENNLSGDWPLERRRNALLKIIELTLAQNKTEEAIQKLENFVKQNADDPAGDVAILTIGELRLKEFFTKTTTNVSVKNPATVELETNLLVQARAQFERLLTVFTNSDYTAKARFDRGWCFWIARQIPESFADFQFAAEKLPHSAEQAIARFKMGDCQFLLGDFSGALTSYSKVTTNYSSISFVQDELVEPALYQMVRAAHEARDEAAEGHALKQILDAYPKSFVSERSMIFVGQGLTRSGNPAAARKLFSEFKARYPNSTLLPEVELAIARTYERESNWPAAIETYNAWLGNFTNHESRAVAEFDRAWANDQGGNQTNAFMLFTNFVAIFPTHELAPLAQHWIGDYFYNQHDYQNAESSYRLLMQKWPASPLARPATMAAGRAAMAREEPGVAANYFTSLINDLQCPPEILGQAFFALGDSWMKRTNFQEAVVTLGKIQQQPLLKTNDIAPLALGRIGDCYLQLAAQKNEYYAEASRAYQQVIDSAEADIGARSQAEVGLAIVLEKLAEKKTGSEKAQLLKSAADHYLTVDDEQFLRPGEKSDAFWVNKARLAASRIKKLLDQASK